MICQPPVFCEYDGFWPSCSVLFGLFSDGVKTGNGVRETGSWNDFWLWMSPIYLPPIHA